MTLDLMIRREIMNKVDYSQYPDSSIPVYYSVPKGFLTYTGQIIPKHLKRKVYFMTPKRASEVLDLIPYQEYLDGDITKQDEFIHKDWGKKMDFSKFNRAIQANMKLGDTNVIELVSNLLKNYPFTVKEKSKKISKKEAEEARFQTDLGYRFDLDYIE